MAISYGVYPHATIGTANDVVETGPTSRWYSPGYVVREVTQGLPYGRMMPVRQYSSRTQAQRFADKLNSRH